MQVPKPHLAALQHEQLEIWVSEARIHRNSGQLPAYIPQLAEANPDEFSLQVRAIEGQAYAMGNGDRTFPFMSVIKPFLLLYLLCELGHESVFSRVGCEPSEQPFNSLAQLQADRGWPRNPMINSGAIALASLLPGRDAIARCQTLQNWLNSQGNCRLFLDRSMLDSVYSLPNQTNREIALELAKSGYLENPEIALDTYNHICCLSGTIAEVANLGMLLVQGPNPAWLEAYRTVKALMTTCGLYQASGRFAVQVGLPTKSGVSGLILSVVPQQGVIACYSPPLNATGNSVVGVLLLEKIAQALRLSVFD